MNFSYFTYVMVPFLMHCCCCFLKNRGNLNTDESDRANEKWFERSKRSIEKFELAKKKLESEIDMKNIINYTRITNFLNKIKTSRR